MKCRRYTKFLAGISTSLILLSLLVNSANAATGDTTRVSVDSNGTQGSSDSMDLSISTELSASPMMFIENVGQLGDGVRFQAYGGSNTIRLGKESIWMTVLEQNIPTSEELGAFPPSAMEMADIKSGSKGVNIKLSFVGANPAPRLEPFNRLVTSVNYFIGNKPLNWKTNVPVWGGVRYIDIYPGIDLEVTGDNGQMVQRLVAQEGSNLNAVQLHVDGADNIALQDGNLILTTALGAYTLPLLQINGTASAMLQSPAVAGNQVTSPFIHAQSESTSHNAQSGNSDLLYSTFLGGSNLDRGQGVAIFNDAMYVTGFTQSSDFPITPGAFDPSYSNTDAFVVKLNPADSSQNYATFLGGTDDDEGYDIAVDSYGAAYITGRTFSTDFPITNGTFDTSFNGNFDAFIVKLDPSGSALDYATYLGGSSDEYGNAIAVDTEGTTYVTGYTSSYFFPTTPGAFDTTYNGGWEAYVVKLDPTGSTLNYGTFMGLYSTGDGIAVDSNGSAYITGKTLSGSFPTTTGAFDTTYNGDYDAFVVKLNPAGSALSFSTFLGTSNTDIGNGIAVDANGNAFVVGSTVSSAFPTTPGAFDTTYNGGTFDVFITKFSSDGSALDYSTFIGGNGEDVALGGIAINSSGAAYVAGYTSSTNFPTTPDAFDTTLSGAYNVFIAKLNAAGSTINYATYLGGSANDIDWGIANDTNGGVYITGGTYSTDFPTSPGAFDTSFNGLEDAFVVKLAVMGGGEPFLDLPFDYDGTVSSFLMALQNWNKKNGRVESWFDHKYPNYGYNDGTGIWLYNGKHTQNSYWAGKGILCYDTFCYDGHNGIDFSYQDPQPDVPGNQPLSIHPAASGSVVKIKTGCIKGITSSGCGGFGNYVVILHPNGYFTFYGHLASVNVTEGNTVTHANILGIMGSTGNSTNTHLHFGVYLDNSNGLWDGENIDKPVDPYGWTMSEDDPWVSNQGPVSTLLWLYDPNQQISFQGDQGTIYTDLTNQVQVNIPPDLFNGQVIMDLSIGPVSGTSVQLRSGGPSFLLNIQEGVLISQQSNILLSGSSQSTLSQPITLAVNYSDSSSQHLDATQLSLYHWDDSQGLWQPLTTSLDTTHHIASAQTQELGSFDLLAPLICPTDSLEPNDNYDGASYIPTDGTQVNNIFDIATDEDWFKFDTVAGAEYHIQTTNLATGVDTVLEIYDTDGMTFLITDDNGGGGNASSLTWQAPTEGTYYVRVTQATGSAYGCNANYEIGISVKYRIYLPLVNR